MPAKKNCCLASLGSIQLSVSSKKNGWPAEASQPRLKLLAVSRQLF
jgi:hypothetical protein